MDSDVRALCRRIYRETIEKQENTELKRALRTHERVPAFIDNLAREVSRLKFSVKKESIEAMVRDMTAWFIKCVDLQAVARVESKMAQIMREKRAQEAEEFRKEAEALEAQGEHRVTQDQKGETDHQIVRLK